MRNGVEKYIWDRKRNKAERRKLTYKAIRKHFRVNSVPGRKNNCIPEKAKEQPHRLYKGRNYKNYGGYSYSTRNLGPSRRDRRGLERAEEMLAEY